VVTRCRVQPHKPRSIAQPTLHLLDGAGAESMIRRWQQSLSSFRLITIFLYAASITIMLAITGCLAPALGLAPLALQAGEAAGVGAIDAAGYAAEGKSDSRGGADDKEERCDELELEIPGTIEFRVADDNPTAWRQLQLGGSTDAPQWQAVAGQQSDPAGWRPLSNLQTMRFAPPLEQALRGGKPNYLAYAPAEPRTSLERDQLVALVADFGVGLGTFQWNGRVYQYTLVNRLPCFPGPVVANGRNAS
ncbi:MAG TPA: hypothetical protein VJ728_07660, partial [Candidatus Binataceae bacterium]|nr:hypothetical protein [Candidatus Binataceae bacterium]